ncbi:MAG: hypothetical protein KBT03_11005 [Bacteroidales bacterium]|nr:hypothetical protein [Candidatus Scybalousia scybalohippi]
MDIEDAQKEHTREDRISAIERVIRLAVSRSPIVSFNGVLHVFDGKKYSPFTWGDMYDALRNTLEKYGMKGCTHSRVKDFVNTCMLAIKGNEHQIDNTIVVMENGVYDTSDMCLHDYNEKYMTNVSVDYAYNPNDVPVLWKTFLDEVVPDTEHQLLLQEFMAGCFIDRSAIKFEHMMILKGSGANGKSVVFETILDLMGKENVSNFSVSDLIGRRREYNIAAILGKRLNYCSEIRTIEISKGNADAFKSLVSGEPTMARVMYHSPFKAVGIPLLMANANTLPTLCDTSESVRRRLIILPFNTVVSIERQNVELATELKCELPAIFNWTMSGLKRLKERNYKIVIPESVQSIVDDYIHNKSIYTRWIMDAGYYKEYHEQTLSVAVWMSIRELYESFTKWCKRNKETPRKKSEFSIELEKLGFSRTRRNIGEGFYIYKSVSSDELLEASMDLAIARERRYGKAMIDAEMLEGDRPMTKDIGKLEKYLGIPEDSIWYYLGNGLLEGTYRKDPDGPRFDVRKVQEALAKSGFYNELRDSGKNLKDKSIQTKRVYARKFNDRMRMIGEPFRMYDNNTNLIPVGERNCIVVPYGWEYSAENAKHMIKMIEFNANSLRNGKD